MLPGYERARSAKQVSTDIQCACYLIEFVMCEPRCFFSVICLLKCDIVVQRCELLTGSVLGWVDISFSETSKFCVI